MSEYSGYRWSPLDGFNHIKWKDPFAGVGDWFDRNRKYWDAQYYFEDPKSYDQLKDQKFVSGLPGMGWLDNYHVAKETEEKFGKTMDLYDLNFSDIKYPYLTALGATSAAVGSAVGSSALMVSKNLSRLYH